MPLHPLPRLNEAVEWLPENPRTVLRYAPNGGLMLLHATDEAALTSKAWQTRSLQLGLFGASLDETAPEVPPVLCARLGEQWSLAAPACIFDLGEEATIYEWLNTRAVPAELRLVLVRLEPGKPGQATVEASRRIWAPQWAGGEALLRLRLQQQYRRTRLLAAGRVQQAGSQLLARVPACELLSRATFRFEEPGQGPGKYSTTTTAAVFTN